MHGGHHMMLHVSRTSTEALSEKASAWSDRSANDVGERGPESSCNDL